VKKQDEKAIAEREKVLENTDKELKAMLKVLDTSSESNFEDFLAYHKNDAHQMIKSLLEAHGRMAITCWTLFTYIATATNDSRFFNLVTEYLTAIDPEEKEDE